MRLCHAVLVLWLGAALIFSLRGAPTALRKLWWRLAFWLLILLPAFAFKGYMAECF